jgi:hypothetical protein
VATPDKVARTGSKDGASLKPEGFKKQPAKGTTTKSPGNPNSERKILRDEIEDKNEEACHSG